MFFQPSEYHLYPLLLMPSSSPLPAAVAAPLGTHFKLNVISSKLIQQPPVSGCPKLSTYCMNYVSSAEIPTASVEQICFWGATLWVGKNSISSKFPQ
jgi:hypothetical protein